MKFANFNVFSCDDEEEEGLMRCVVIEVQGGLSGLRDWEIKILFGE